MGRLDSVLDFGQVLNVSGATITTSYKFSASFQAVQVTRLAVWFSLTTAGSGSTYTSANIKVQVSYDGTNWTDVQIVNETTGTASNVQNVVAPAAGNTAWTLLQTSSHNPSPCGIRIAYQFVGAAGVSGDVIVCNAAGM